MAKLMTLHELMIHQLRDVYNAEKQLVQALPKMAKNCDDEALQQAFTKHLGETEEQVARLEQVFELLGVPARGIKCKAMEGLLEEGKELLEEDVDPQVLDAGLIAAAQRVEHYEIAAYGTLCEYARAMGHDDVLQLLELTLEEEKQTDLALTALAEGGINALAARDGMESADDDDSDESTESDDDDAEGESTTAQRKSAPAKKAPAKTARSTRSASTSTTKRR